MRFARFVYPSNLLLLALVLCSASGASAGVIAGRVVEVFDGDTFLLQTNTGEQIKVRVAEIDAPEGDQPYGDASTRLLAQLVSGKQVQVVVKTTDDYGRTVGRPFTTAADVAAEMIREGAAWAYRQYLTDQQLLRLEEDARLARVGLWGVDVDPVPPWDWRHAEPRRSCDIKGNISSRGERIYHVPGQRYYGATQINASHGERWFCTEAQALAAGWRRSRT